ncbi:hypothetical protein Bca101_101859 [Brassica carinata]
MEVLSTRLIMELTCAHYQARTFPILGLKLEGEVEHRYGWYGPYELRATKIMFRLNHLRRLGVGAKIRRGTDRRSVPSTVLVPDQPEMKLCKLRAQEKTNLSYLVTVHGSLKGTNQEPALALTSLNQPISIHHVLSNPPDSILAIHFNSVISIH